LGDHSTTAATLTPFWLQQHSFVPPPYSSFPCDEQNNHTGSSEETTDRYLTVDSIHSTADSEMISSSHCLPLSPKDLELLWGDQRMVQEGNDGHNFSSSYPFDHPMHNSSSSPPSSYLVHSSSVPSRESHSTVDPPTPSCWNSSPLVPPYPIELQLTINSFENDLLVQGRQGIGSFDVSILSSDMRRISLAVSGQMIAVTFDSPTSSSSLSPASSMIPLPPTTSVTKDLTRISSCHIHLDLISLTLGYLQASQLDLAQSAEEVEDPEGPFNAFSSFQEEELTSNLHEGDFL
jgi:hypothetical protein